MELNFVSTRMRMTFRLQENLSFYGVLSVWIAKSLLFKEYAISFHFKTQILWFENS